MYLLVLAALLQFHELAPKFISPHDSFEECVAAAQKQRFAYKEELAKPESKELGLQFVCVKIVGDV